MKQIKFLLVPFFILLSTNLFSLDISFDLNVGGSASFPFSTLSNMYNLGIDISGKIKGQALTQDEKDEIIKDLSDIINISSSGVRYGIYTQLGANFNNFIAVGGEFVFNFNVFQPVNNNGTKHAKNAFLMGLYPRLYAKLDLFLLSLTLFLGPEINLAFTDSDSILKDSEFFYMGLGGRITMGWLMIEGFYSWNTKDSKFSDFHIGIGLEFSIF